ncbi:hypothetical protein [Streptomyces sp. NPDC050560]|uniref:hypothetical protein n=1 Tax=Streptomyces sp. NPDC050560 TaxID=3365630 RepID=UPI003797E27D
MSDITGTGHRETATAIVHESYSFACMRCGHGWEQSYEIEHHVDAEGKEFVAYYADGFHVPSPLTEPSCHNCGGHVVRIMRPGRVSSARHPMSRPGAHAGLAPQSAPQAGPITPTALIAPTTTTPAESAPAKSAAGATAPPTSHSVLRHPFAALRRLLMGG